MEIGLGSFNNCKNLYPGRTEKGAKTGKELDLYDESYPESNAVKRLEKARSLSIFKTEDHNEGYRLISEECEYSDSIDDYITIREATNGAEALRLCV